MHGEGEAEQTPGLPSLGDDIVGIQIEGGDEGRGEERGTGQVEPGGRHAGGGRLRSLSLLVLTLTSSPSASSFYPGPPSFPPSLPVCPFPVPSAQCKPCSLEGSGSLYVTHPALPDARLPTNLPDA